MRTLTLGLCLALGMAPAGASALEPKKPSDLVVLIGTADASCDAGTG